MIIPITTKLDLAIKRSTQYKIEQCLYHSNHLSTGLKNGIHPIHHVIVKNISRVGNSINIVNSKCIRISRSNSSRNVQLSKLLIVSIKVIVKLCSCSNVIQLLRRFFELRIHKCFIKAEFSRSDDLSRSNRSRRVEARDKSTLSTWSNCFGRIGVPNSNLLGRWGCASITLGG
jgi:hypothetical protein